MSDGEQVQVTFFFVVLKTNAVCPILLFMEDNGGE